MANKNDREIRFQLNDDDYKAFGRYRILYTEGGRKMVNRQRITYVLSGIMIAVLFSIFKVDRSFTILAYIVAAVMAVGGAVMAQKLVLRQQERAINDDANNLERVHPDQNIINFEEDLMRTRAGSDEQEFKYSDIQQVDMTEDAIYVWMSDTMIMPLPLHAFKNEEAMDEMYDFLQEKTGSKDRAEAEE